MEERDDIIAYLDSLKEGVNGKTAKQIKEEYEIFKTEKYAKELLTIADKYNVSAKALEAFVKRNYRTVRYSNGEKSERLACSCSILVGETERRKNWH